jgi:predicted flavoprotein YhiN
LGLDTFVGTSQRVFPTDMKAAPLLRAWLHRLRHPAQGTPATFHMRHRWNGALQHNVSAPQPFHLVFDIPQGPHTTEADAVVLALGGGSWAKLGSDGAWQPWLSALGLDVAPLRPANCGFDVQGWSTHLSSQFAGTPLKAVALSRVAVNLW